MAFDEQQSPPYMKCRVCVRSARSPPNAMRLLKLIRLVYHSYYLIVFQFVCKMHTEKKTHKYIYMRHVGRLMCGFPMRLIKIAFIEYLIINGREVRLWLGKYLRKRRAL